ncbi:tyrosine-type recombinase/integrase [Methylomonas rhizoryzae]|uniref:tyrosine-type recombinase/integrase n=1 Tax=Methylomonas rhizoryzae TaxID=2608981 RepID=UPI001232D13B|nr:site-specific integrase [Methylomonas rhizoryzae]
MAQNKITDLSFRTLKPTHKVQMVSDGGGLFVRVRPAKEGGAKSFMFDYRLNGKQCRITLVEAKTLAEARKLRDECRQLVQQGKDPRIERQLEAERNRVAQLAEQEALSKQQAVISVHHLFERWVNTDLLERKDLAEIRRMFAKDVLPIVGGLSVQDVRKGHITEVTDKIKQRGSASTARNTLKLIKQMFLFAVTRDIIEFSPAAALSVSKTTTKNNERSRVLSQDEIKTLSVLLPGSGLASPTQNAIWIMLSTCCRVGELSKAEWQHIDFEKRIWLIPEQNSKNGKAHTIYLSGFAFAQFERLPKRSESWLFPNRENSNHVCEKSITRQIDGRQNLTVYSNRSKSNQSLVLPGGKWTPHDLRRSGATLMGDLGIDSDIIEKCINHTEENKMKRVYQHQKLMDEQREAWRLLGEKLDALTGVYFDQNRR